MSETYLPVLIVEDDPSLREAIGDTLELAGRAYIAVDGGANISLTSIRPSIQRQPG